MILDQDENYFKKGVKESININQPSLYRDSETSKSVFGGQSSEEGHKAVAAWRRVKYLCWDSCFH